MKIEYERIIVNGRKIRSFSLKIPLKIAELRVNKIKKIKKTSLMKFDIENFSRKIFLSLQIKISSHLISVHYFLSLFEFHRFLTNSSVNECRFLLLN